MKTVERQKRMPFDVTTARAFTVKPAWGWLIMKGVKDIENRSITVQPPKGVCVVTFSKSYTEMEHYDIIESIEDDDVFRMVPEYEDLRKLCGKAVGVVDYHGHLVYRDLAQCFLRNRV